LGRTNLLEPAKVRSRRVILLVAMLVVAGGSASLTWWMTTLSGLPDIGDPFDVSSVVDPPVPDDENAFTLYREAVAKLVAEPSDMTYNWATAGPVEKGWLERNRPAMEIWRRGTERSRALYIPARSITIETQLPVVQEMRAFARLAQLEGGRLEAEGDLEGAWRVYRAIFRSSRHVGQRWTAIERLVGTALHQVASRQLTRWASDPRVTPAMLRRALDAVIADHAPTGPVSDMLKVEYLAFLKTFDDPKLVWTILNDPSMAGPGKTPWFVRDNRSFSLARAWLKEPERSRRVTRLIYANLMAYCDLPPGRRPPVACTLAGVFGGGPPALLDLYKLDASAPAQARALPPDEILKWFDTTLYAKQLIPASNALLNAVDRERVAQASLIIALANRLYEVERGKVPETAEELVGPYLKALPDGYKPYAEPNPPRNVP
jgi:hypothetical protein